MILYFFCLSTYEEKKTSAHCVSREVFFSLHNLINRKKYKIIPYNLITNKKIKQSIHETLLFLVLLLLLLNSTPFNNCAKPWLFCFT